MVSMAVIAALDLCAVTKRYTVGSGSCLASADVLRGISLTVTTGESVALVGSSGAGKSTLMLCASGLLRFDSGDVRWFGESDRAVAARRAVYHCAPSDLRSSPCAAQPTLHLLDVAFAVESGRAVAGWIERRCDAGDAVIVSTRDEDLARHVASRVVVLRGGRLCPDAPPRARVAELARD
jgi:ABC-type multidrug transport system ATPase subunit